MPDQQVAIVTGAGSGIGRAVALALGEEGYRLALVGRDADKLQSTADSVPEALLIAADLSEADAALMVVDKTVDRWGRVDVLVNNAGGALGVDRVEDAPERRWQDMWELNFLSTVRMTKALLPALRASGDALIVNVGSIAGFETYANGGGYTGAKHAVRALTRTLRIELLGEPIRITEIAPGLVETEFSLVRFDQDAAKAKAVYKNMTPLTGEDIADSIAWVATRPSHVNIDEMVIRPRDQATATLVHRGGSN